MQADIRPHDNDLDIANMIRYEVKQPDFDVFCKGANQKISRYACRWNTDSFSNAGLREIEHFESK
jgi:hypothetical protein